MKLTLLIKKNQSPTPTNNKEVNIETIIARRRGEDVRIPLIWMSKITY